jgi:hypothetical protein
MKEVRQKAPISAGHYLQPELAGMVAEETLIAEKDTPTSMEKSSRKVDYGSMPDSSFS